ncbi:uncharacterized protein JCM6883_002087 [Sporobolomyces salmoneus]|uniref:uncharacterized protein n=1 Tax=Sporobolomyces salmoneus TaxID=183962 RepID=UPI0031765A0B
MPNRTLTQAKRGGFEPLKGLRWTAETEVEFIKQLVQNREELFAKHRRLVDPEIEASNWGTLDQLARSDVALQAVVDRYSEFCTVNEISTFPLSFSSLALFVFAKCGHQNGHLLKQFERIRRLRAATSRSWRSVAGYSESENTEEVQEAFKDFMAERESLRIKGVEEAPGVTHESSTTASSSDADPSESDSEEETSNSDADAEFSGSELSALSDLDGEAEGGNSGESTIASTSSGGVRQLVVPNLPQAGDRYTSINRLFIATYKALVPVYGCGVNLDELKDGTAWLRRGRSHTAYRKSVQGRCSWKIGAEVCSSTGEAVVKQALSHLVHNHGPSARISKNPNHRPVVINPIIREAFGLTPLGSSRGRKDTSQDLKQSQSQKRPKLSASNQETSVSKSRPRHDNEVTYPSAPQSSQHFDKAARLRLSSSSTRSLPLAPSPFSHELESFLEGLDPSLPHLASTLIEEGIDSFKTLVLFCSLSPYTIDQFVDSLCEKTRASGGTTSLHHLHLFGRMLKEAQEGDYKDSDDIARS